MGSQQVHSAWVLGWDITPTNSACASAEDNGVLFSQEKGSPAANNTRHT